MTRIDRSKPIRPFDRRARQLKKKRWYVLRVSPQREIIAEAALRLAGFEAFAPTEELWRKKNRFARKKTRYLRAIMPGYVFAGLPSEEGGYGVDWPALAWLDAVRGREGDNGRRPFVAARAQYEGKVIRGVICENGLPKAIPFRAIKRFAAESATPVIHAPGEHRFMATHREFNVGDKARIAYGSLEGHEVPIVGFEGDKARIKLTLFGKETIQELPLYQLEAG
ncbi:transcription termination/antitermination protein NusG [Euryhalocaulis caribicus]|uniref:transcription termination/antitermination protein NusG n=1 Tax=Euryhalocaulis caribicus TaxID=1161401 RepID=UPI00039F9BF3|nr:transcription termination/antitermination NusG family protein [Euryhalocaulis caribicus]